MDKPRTVVIEDLSEIHANRAYAAAANDNPSHTTGAES